MRVIKRPTLLAYCRQYPDAEQQLLAWLKEAEHAHWTGPQDIRARYNNADFPTGQHVIFNIKGNHYRLIARVHYASQTSQGIVFIRWFGPHKEYDKLNVEQI